MNMRRNANPNNLVIALTTRTDCERTTSSHRASIPCTHREGVSRFVRKIISVRYHNVAPLIEFDPQ
jgi:hypothetical protein